MPYNIFFKMPMCTMEWQFLIILYVIIVIVNAYVFILYSTACRKMKNTLMIQSVVVMLGTFLFENIYFLVVSLGTAYNIVFIQTVLVSPLLWAIPKFGVLIGLFYFIYATLTPTTILKKKIEKMEELPKKIITKK